MATYVIGDIHGCYREFKALLKKIHFSPNHDQLYLVGDLINRGPKSSDVLEMILDLGHSCHAVLGNHDLAFLVLSEGHIKPKKSDTYQSLLDHPHLDSYLHYIKHLPLVHYITDYQTIITHAGLAPTWSLECVLKLSHEVQQVIQNPVLYPDFMRQLFGNTPDLWHDDLKGYDRLRCIVNYCTRIRFLHRQNFSLDFSVKDQVIHAPANLIPWFQVYDIRPASIKIIYGHWAALGLHQESRSLCIDTGAVWGDRLTAVRIDSPLPVFTHIASGNSIESVRKNR